MNLNPYLKAVFAGLTAALTALGGYLVKNASLSHVTAGQWVYVAIAGLAGLGIVYTVPNVSKKP